MGRLLSIDPVQADTNAGNNFDRYAYANNNPVSFSDPDGRTSKYVTANSAWLSQSNDSDVDSEEAAAFDAKLDEALPKLFNTEMGQKIKAQAIENGGVTIKTNNDNQFKSVPSSGEIYVDPLGGRVTPTTEGPQRATLEVLIGHEMGHGVLGLSDDGPGNMNNVNSVENPIRQELQQPARTSYEQPSQND